MASNLRDRLRRIQESLPRKTPPAGASAESPPPPEAPASSSEAADAALFGAGWSPAGFKTLKRTIYRALNRKHFAPLYTSPPSFPPGIQILIPDMFNYAQTTGKPPSPANLLFFDLETTGLSGGAGTVAFLAAFARVVFPPRLRVTQYLLLDYPGEYEFLEALLPEFSTPDSGPPLVITYNGKSFDTPLLKTRCLMNGITPPVYLQGDLLHPARRLWKRVLPSCSQGTVETEILGLDRAGDIPGSQAPDIWFSFLRTGLPGDLPGVCDHNVLDLFGLARLTAAFAEIAEAPLSAAQIYRCDPEGLALRYRKQAIHAERRLKDPPLALEFAEIALAFLENESMIYDITLRQRNRLLRKLSKLGGAL